LACGIPVVATDVGSVSYMLKDGVNGFVVPIRDVERLSQAIRAVLDAPPNPDVVRASPAVRSWDAVAGDVRNTFCKILGHSTSSYSVSKDPASEIQSGATQ
jgi:glycosyltransferase involved in cell wall biosynthesis